jgi:multidrug resistance protein
MRKSPLFIIFSTVFMDLVGFGMIISLLGLYGKHLGASGPQLGLLGASYSLMQFFFAPLWGRLSDRHGRRPILLMSLCGSTLAYLGFAGATLMQSYALLLATRAFQGIFAANISAAQAYIADITPVEKRAQGMGLIGAAFGIGFILGPALGGIAAKRIGLAAPGFLAAAICGVNFALAWVRLPESLALEIQKKNQALAPRSYDPLNFRALRRSLSHPFLWLLLSIFFLQTFAFSNVEQTFALLFQSKFGWPVEDAGERTGIVLAWVGFLGALVQGGLIRKLVPRFGESRLLMAGLALFAVTIGTLPFGPSYRSYFVLMLPLAFGRGMIDPSISSLISRSAPAAEQGETFGISQGLSSLARALGPFCGLLSFQVHPYLPFLIAAWIVLGVLGLSIWFFFISKKQFASPAFS